jgi:serine protease Do
MRLRQGLPGLALLLLAALPARGQPAPGGWADQVAPLLATAVSVDAIAATANGRMVSQGSGFIVAPSGLIATNRHVIAGAYAVKVAIPGLGDLDAKVLYVSEAIDLAILKVEAGQPLPAVTLGDSDGVRVGDEVLLLGNPLGVGESLSHGVISALNRDIGETRYDHFFQTDAAINHGNSGGPMFNLRGEVIGINTALDSSPGNTGSVGVGFALPINDAKFALSQFLHDGRVVAGTIGVRAQRVTPDLAAAFGLDHPHGLLVTEVDPSGPAAGRVQVGDLLLAVNGRDASDAREMERWVVRTPVGQALALRLARAGAERNVDVPVRALDTGPNAGLALLGHMPATATTVATPSNPGMRLAEITPALRRRYGLADSATGLVVTEVAPSGPAAGRRIAVGDLLVSVGTVPVGHPRDLQAALQAGIDRHLPFAALLVQGARGRRWVALPLEATH